MLHPLKIVSLCVSISCFFPKRSKSAGRRDEESKDEAENYLKDLSLDVLTARLQADIPSLETVSLTLEGHPHRPRTKMVIGAVLEG